MAGQQNRIVAIVGRKGSGKSTRFRQLMQRCECLFVWDPHGEHAWIPNRFYGLDEVNRFLAWTQFQDTFAGSFICEGDEEEGFAQVADWIYQDCDVTFGIEEAASLCSASYLPNEFSRLVRLGRHNRIDLTWTAQSFAEVSRRLTAATDYFILFQQTEPRDLDAIAYRCGREIAERVAALPMHGSLAWDAVSRRVLGGGVLRAAMVG